LTAKDIEKRVLNKLKVLNDQKLTAEAKKIFEDLHVQTPRPWMVMDRRKGPKPTYKAK